MFGYLKVNEKRVISVDVPSGWEVDKGNVYSTFYPFANVSLGVLKKCDKDYQGIHYLCDHYMPDGLLEEYGVESVQYTNPNDLFVRIK